MTCDYDERSWLQRNVARCAGPHASTLTRDIDVGVLSVRPSVRHGPVLYRNGLT